MKYDPFPNTQLLPGAAPPSALIETAPDVDIFMMAGAFVTWTVIPMETAPIGLNSLGSVPSWATDQGSLPTLTDPATLTVTTLPTLINFIAPSLSDASCRLAKES